MQTSLFEKPTAPAVELRDYQVGAKRKLYGSVREANKRILVCAPCGWGKTFYTASIIQDAISKGKKALFVVPFRTLVGQAIEAFEKMEIDYGVIAGGYSENYWAPAQIATIQTLGGTRDISWFNYDILILDEAHIVGFSEWVKETIPLLKNGEEVLSAGSFLSEMETLGFHTDFHLPTWEEIKAKYSQIKHEATAEQKTAYFAIEKYKGVFENVREPNHKIIIGLTGSPERLSKKEFMSDIFRDQVATQTPKEMIEMGMLVGCDYFNVKGADLTGVHTQGGEYVQNEISERCSDPEVVEWAVTNYRQICPDRTFICFAVDCHHAGLLVAEFQKQGVDAHIVTAQTPDYEREKLFSDLGSGKIQGLVSVGCLSVGFDVPSISCVISCRPTLSKSLWIQQVGRGMRLSPGKEDCIVLDQAGNRKRFGRIEDYEYPPLNPQNGFTVETVPTKECPECGRIHPVFQQDCPCGYVFETMGGAEKVRPVGEMELHIAEDDKPMYDSYRSMLRTAFYKGYSPDWAVMQTQQRFQRFPKRQWAKNAVFGKEPTKFHQLMYETYLDNIIKKKQEQDIPDKTKKRYNSKWKEKHFYNEFGVIPCQN